MADNNTPTIQRASEGRAIKPSVPKPGQKTSPREKAQKYFQQQRQRESKEKQAERAIEQLQRKSLEGKPYKQRVEILNKWVEQNKDLFKYKGAAKKAQKALEQYKGKHKSLSEREYDKAVEKIRSIQKKDIPAPEKTQRVSEIVQEAGPVLGRGDRAGRATEKILGKSQEQQQQFKAKAKKNVEQAVKELQRKKLKDKPYNERVEILNEWVKQNKQWFKAPEAAKKAQKALEQYKSQHKTLSSKEHEKFIDKIESIQKKDIPAPEKSKKIGSIVEEAGPVLGFSEKAQKKTESILGETQQEVEKYRSKAKENVQKAAKQLQQKDFKSMPYKQRVEALNKFVEQNKEWFKAPEAADKAKEVLNKYQSRHETLSKKKHKNFIDKIESIQKKDIPVPEKSKKISGIVEEAGPVLGYSKEARKKTQDILGETRKKAKEYQEALPVKRAARFDHTKYLKYNPSKKQFEPKKGYKVERYPDGAIKKIQAEPKQYKSREYRENGDVEDVDYGKYSPEEIRFDKQGRPTRKIQRGTFVHEDEKDADGDSIQEKKPYTKKEVIFKEGKPAKEKKYDLRFTDRDYEEGGGHTMRRRSYVEKEIDFEKGTAKRYDKPHASSEYVVFSGEKGDRSVTKFESKEQYETLKQEAQQKAQKRQKQTEEVVENLKSSMDDIETPEQQMEFSKKAASKLESKGLDAAAEAFEKQAQEIQWLQEGHAMRERQIKKKLQEQEQTETAEKTIGEKIEDTSPQALRSIAGVSPGGKITEKDIEKYKSQAAEAAFAQPVIDPTGKAVKELTGKLPSDRPKKTTKLFEDAYDVSQSQQEMKDIQQRAQELQQKEAVQDYISEAKEIQEKPRSMRTRAEIQKVQKLEEQAKPYLKEMENLQLQFKQERATVEDIKGTKQLEVPARFVDTEDLPEGAIKRQRKKREAAKQFRKEAQKFEEMPKDDEKFEEAYTSKQAEKQAKQTAKAAQKLEQSYRFDQVFGTQKPTDVEKQIEKGAGFLAEQAKKVPVLKTAMEYVPEGVKETATEPVKGVAKGWRKDRELPKGHPMAKETWEQRMPVSPENLALVKEGPGKVAEMREKAGKPGLYPLQWTKGAFSLVGEGVERVREPVVSGLRTTAKKLPEESVPRAALKKTANIGEQFWESMGEGIETFGEAGAGATRIAAKKLPKESVPRTALKKTATATEQLGEDIGEGVEKVGEAGFGAVRAGAKKFPEKSIARQKLKAEAKRGEEFWKGFGGYFRYTPVQPMTDVALAVGTYGLGSWASGARWSGRAARAARGVRTSSKARKALRAGKGIAAATPTDETVAKSMIPSLRTMKTGEKIAFQSPFTRKGLRAPVKGLRSPFYRKPGTTPPWFTPGQKVAGTAQGLYGGVAAADIALAPKSERMEKLGKHAAGMATFMGTMGGIRGAGEGLARTGAYTPHLRRTRKVGKQILKDEPTTRKSLKAQPLTATQQKKMRAFEAGLRKRAGVKKPKGVFGTLKERAVKEQVLRKTEPEEIGGMFYQIRGEKFPTKKVTQLVTGETRIPAARFRGKTTNAEVGPEGEVKAYQIELKPKQYGRGTWRGEPIEYTGATQKLTREGESSTTLRFKKLYKPEQYKFIREGDDYKLYKKTPDTKDWQIAKAGTDELDDIKRQIDYLGRKQFTKYDPTEQVGFQATTKTGVPVKTAGYMGPEDLRQATQMRYGKGLGIQKPNLRKEIAQQDAFMTKTSPERLIRPTAAKPQDTFMMGKPKSWDMSGTVPQKPRVREITPDVYKQDPIDRTAWVKLSKKDRDILENYYDEFAPSTPEKLSTVQKGFKQYIPGEIKGQYKLRYKKAKFPQKGQQKPQKQIMEPSFEADFTLPKQVVRPEPMDVGKTAYDIKSLQKIGRAGKKLPGATRKTGKAAAEKAAEKVSDIAESPLWKNKGATLNRRTPMRRSKTKLDTTPDEPFQTQPGVRKSMQKGLRKSYKRTMTRGPKGARGVGRALDDTLSKPYAQGKAIKTPTMGLTTAPFADLTEQVMPQTKVTQQKQQMDTFQEQDYGTRLQAQPKVKMAEGLMQEMQTKQKQYKDERTRTKPIPRVQPRTSLEPIVTPTTYKKVKTQRKTKIKPPKQVSTTENINIERPGGPLPPPPKPPKMPQINVPGPRPPRPPLPEREPSQAQEDEEAKSKYAKKQFGYLNLANVKQRAKKLKYV